RSSAQGRSSAVCDTVSFQLPEPDCFGAVGLVGEFAGHQPAVPEIDMVATTVLERLAGAGEAILEENNAALGPQFLAIFGAAAELQRGAQMVFPQPVGQGLRATGM